MTARRISALTALTIPPRPLIWCCITTAGAGWPSTAVNAGFMSTACGCPRSSSTTVGPSPSAIPTTDHDWSSNSALRCLYHRGMRRRPGCGRRRLPPVRLGNPVAQPGRLPLHRHPGQISRNGRRFRRRQRCRHSRDRPASTQRRNRISRYRPLISLAPNDFRHPSQSQNRNIHPSGHRRLNRSPRRRNRTRSSRPGNFRRSNRHRRRRIRSRRLKLSCNQRQPGPRLPSASGHRSSHG